MTETTTDPWEDRELYGTGDLARFLGGSEDSFTGLLLVLLQKADPGNVARIKTGFPDVVRAWETWNAMSPCPTPRQLREALERPGSWLDELAKAGPAIFGAKRGDRRTEP
jgi:hypothetical protein